MWKPIRYLQAAIIFFLTGSAMVSAAGEHQAESLFGMLTLSETDLALVSMKKGIDDLPKIERGYNSSNQKRGIFGKGWSTILDGISMANGDRPASLYETCSAMPVDYYPRGSSASGQNKPLTSDLCGGHRLIPIAGGGYERTDCKSLERYNAEGRLVAIRAGKEYIVQRDDMGRVAALVASGGNTVTLEYGPQGLVRKMVGFGGEINYRYDTRQRLIKVSCNRETAITYEYDSHDRLVKVAGKGGGKEQTISYLPDEEGGWVKSIQHSDGRFTRLQYSQGAFTTPQFTIMIEKGNERDRKDSRRSTSTFTMNDQGSRKWVRKVVHSDDYGTEEREYGVNGILTINQHGRTAHFTYDQLGRLVRKEVDGGVNEEGGIEEARIVELAYLDESEKPISVRRYAKNAPEKVREARYAYNQQNLLTEAAMTGGERVTLIYDSAGRMTAMRLPDRSVLFAYKGEEKRVSTLAVPGYGAVNITYDSNEKGKIRDQKGQHFAALIFNREKKRFDAILEFGNVDKKNALE